MSATTLWELTTPTGRRVECVMQFAEGGVEVMILVNGEPSARQIFPTGTEAYACAEEEREAWETSGD